KADAAGPEPTGASVIPCIAGAGAEADAAGAGAAGACGAVGTFCGACGISSRSVPVPAPPAAPPLVWITGVFLDASHPLRSAAINVPIASAPATATCSNPGNGHERRMDPTLRFRSQGVAVPGRGSPGVTVFPPQSLISAFSVFQDCSNLPVQPAMPANRETS